MTYLEYVNSNLPEKYIIRPKWINNNKPEFKGGYLKPEWMVFIEDLVDKFNQDRETFKRIDEKDPTKNNKNTSNVIAPNFVDTFRKRVIDGDIMDGYPSSEYSLYNFSVNPIKGS